MMRCLDMAIYLPGLLQPRPGTGWTAWAFVVCMCRLKQTRQPRALIMFKQAIQRCCGRSLLRDSRLIDQPKGLSEHFKMKISARD